MKAPASAGITFLKIFGAVCLGGLCLIAGAIGGCAAVMTPFLIGDDPGSGAIAIGIAVAGFAVAAASIYGIVRIVKR
jgi:hypothetical protein